MSQITNKEKFLAGYEFVGKKGQFIKYRFNTEGCIEILNPGLNTEWAIYSLADGVDDAGFTLFLQALSTKNVFLRFKFDELIFIDNTEEGS
jgi:hypothetical protein